MLDIRQKTRSPVQDGVHGGRVPHGWQKQYVQRGCCYCRSVVVVVVGELDALQDE